MKSLAVYGSACALLTLASATLADDPMAVGLGGYEVSDPLFTVGETINGYTPVGILDGLGAYRLNHNTVRVICNHELLHFRGNEYSVGGAYTLKGARLSYFDIDRFSRQLVDVGLPYDAIYDGNGNLATDGTFLQDGFSGFSRFCSSQLEEPMQFGSGPFWFFRRGLTDRIYFTGEEDGGLFNGVGGAVWALDTANGDMWQASALGRGAWENFVQIDTGRWNYVAFLLSDDSSPFDFGNPNETGVPDGVNEPVPMYLYVGKKNFGGDFLDRNGLRDGKLYAWVADNGDTRPSQFNSSGSRSGKWVEVDNSQQVALASEDGSSGYDEYGYPTQSNLVLQAVSAGAFGFSRPEDLARNPFNGKQAVVITTGVDTYDVDGSGNGADTWGTLYKFDFNFNNIHQPKATVSIVYDGDADPTRSLRSPDNLDWADDGYLYVQEDRAETTSLTGEPLFGAGAVNPNEAGIVKVDPNTGNNWRVANIDRGVVLDPSIAMPELAVDVDAGISGAWETSGIIDVSRLFGQSPGTLFLFDVQAHGIEDQENFNPTSRINDDDLVEGGQLLFLRKNTCLGDVNGDNSVNVIDVIQVIIASGPCSNCVEDVNNDGFVNWLDIVIVLSNFGSCD